jgi:hypothetical protein
MSLLFIVVLFITKSHFMGGVSSPVTKTDWATRDEWDRLLCRFIISQLERSRPNTSNMIRQHSIEAYF